MCFYIEKNKPEIAKQDLVCWKIGRSKWFRLFFVSYYLNFRYKKNKIYSTTMSLKKSVINEGFHSYIDPDYIYANELGCKNARFIIPKGSIYYINKDRGEIVSNQIIFKKFI